MGLDQVSLELDNEAARRDQAERKFTRLRDEWKAKRGHHSDTLTLVMHPAYQSIIGMGPDAIPFLLRELATRPDRWFWALRAITEEDPVPPEDRGNSEAMTRAWLEWGKARGCITGDRVAVGVLPGSREVDK
jgi:hypothetical protein